LNFQVGPGKNNDKTFGTECLDTLRPGDCFVQAAIPEKCRKNSRGAQLPVLNVNFGISRR
ncbi:hypothetical protein, partial [Bacillus cereus]|uniref:hypothetical protein n=1 Tax=Bacillus cereus TaxID=1396 RepID=UPI002111FA7A